MGTTIKDVRHDHRVELVLARRESATDSGAVNSNMYEAVSH